MQVTEFLNETGVGEKTVLFFSDIEEDLVKGYIGNFPITQTDMREVALNVMKLRSDNIDPRDYLIRLE